MCGCVQVKLSSVVLVLPFSDSRRHLPPLSNERRDWTEILHGAQLLSGLTGTDLGVPANVPNLPGGPSDARTVQQPFTSSARWPIVTFWKPSLSSVTCGDVSSF